MLIDCHVLHFASLRQCNMGHNYNRMKEELLYYLKFLFNSCFFFHCVYLLTCNVGTLQKKKVYNKLLPTACKILSDDIRISKTFQVLLLWEIKGKKCYRDQGKVCNPSTFFWDTFHNLFGFFLWLEINLILGVCFLK